MSLKYIFLIALITLQARSAYSSKSISQPSLTAVNTRSYYLGNDLFFRYSEQDKLVYIQNYKTLEIIKSATVPEVSNAYRFNNVVRLESSLILLGQNKRFDLNTFEIKEFPFPDIFSQIVKYKDDKYIALRFDKYCIFTLNEGCTASKEQFFKNPLPKISYSDLYKVSETANDIVFLNDKSSNLILVSLDKNTLEWKVVREDRILIDSPYTRILGTQTDQGILFLAFLAERNDANQKNSFIAAWNLKNGTLKFKELKQYFDDFDLVVSKGKIVELIGKDLTGCWGECPYQRSSNLKINTDDLTFVAGPTPRFELVLGKPIYLYKNSAEISEILQISADQFVKLGSGFKQQKNYNEIFQTGIGFKLVDENVNFQDVCNRSFEMDIFIINSFDRRFCEDIDQQELSKFNYLLSSFFHYKKEIPLGDFIGFVNVRSFDLSESSVEKIKPNQFEGLISLQSLDLSSGSIHEIQPDALQGLSSLIDLKLGGSGFSPQELIIDDGALVGLSALRTLSFGTTKLIASKNIFSGLPLLEYVSFYGVDLRSTEPEILSFLKVKDLSFNGGSQLVLTENTFKGHNEIEKLSLWYLNIDMIPEGFFKDLKNLKFLSLRYNQIKTVSESDLASLINLSVLELYGNPLPQEEISRIKSLLPNTEVRF